MILIKASFIYYFIPMTDEGLFNVALFRVELFFYKHYNIPAF